MQRLKITLIATILVLIFSSCDPCGNLDCLSNNYFGAFRIIKASDGTDMVFGTNRVYDKNKIKFYSLKGTDTTFFDYQPLKSGGTGYDSILYVHFFPQADVPYMRLSNGDIDTLTLSYKTTKTRCCGIITEITNFRYNNAIDMPVGNAPHQIRK